MKKYSLNKNIRKYKIMEKHIELTKTGNYLAARNLLLLLRNGRVRLGLGDEDWETESCLEDIGCPVSYSRDGYGATFRI